MKAYMAVTTPEMRRAAFIRQTVKDACGLLLIVALVLAMAVYG